MSKPPYRVPTMVEIALLKPNGHTVASTFAGAGGSSTGYRIAGFRVVYANEFVPAARDTYTANMQPGTILDPRDIRQVTAEDILNQISMRAGELDVLDGSPPCAAFSTAGKRHKSWGKVSDYSDTEQRSDDLFFEFARILEGVQPRVFVAENVSGLVKGVAKGYFRAILARLGAAGYRVKARLLDASWLGVPQARQRLIFIGVRNDIDCPPIHPTPFPYQYTLRDALPYVPDRPSPTISAGVNSVNSQHFQVRGSAITEDPETGEPITIGRFAIGPEVARLREGESSDRYFNLTRAAHDRPSPTVTAMGGNLGAAAVCHPSAVRKFTLAELRAVCGFPPDYILTGTYAQRWERLGRSVPPVMMAAIAATVRDKILACAD